tara:strand:+ start:208 stop:324 length:117 start_codon:yes stop_codon:yes gene_type:complete
MAEGWFRNPPQNFSLGYWVLLFFIGLKKGIIKESSLGG